MTEARGEITGSGSGEVTAEMVEALCRRGDLDEAYSSNLDHVGEAIAAGARRGLNLT